MAIGFPISGTGITSATIIPDKTLNRSATPKVRVANFGDGYQQRIADGINSIGETYSVNFVNREKAVADDLLALHCVSAQFLSDSWDAWSSARTRVLLGAELSGERKPAQAAKRAAVSANLLILANALR